MHEDNNRNAVHIQLGGGNMTYTEWIRETVIHDLGLEEHEIEQLDDILYGDYEGSEDDEDI